MLRRTQPRKSWVGSPPRPPFPQSERDEDAGEAHSDDGDVDHRCSAMSDAPDSQSEVRAPRVGTDAVKFSNAMRGDCHRP
jgi:hypothetical protein